jgi:diacylglycerol kinase (ATP)
MIVLLNPHAAGGTAMSKWRRLCVTMPPSREDVEVHFLTSGIDIAATITEASARGDRHVLAAGGDGTVHTALNALMQLPEHVRKSFVLGAAGLGSSNDFHKPFEATRLHEGVPVRMDFSKPVWRDVGCVRIGYEMNWITRFFLINASAGITAEGNALFNSPGPVLASLKRTSTPLAIAYAANRALAAHRNIPATLRIPGEAPINLKLTNLGIAKSPHFSGSLHYDTAANYSDGLLQVHAAYDMGLMERFRLLIALSHGRFRGLAKTQSWTLAHLSLTAESPFLLELDGEIHKADLAEFSVVPQAIQVCS